MGVISAVILIMPLWSSHWVEAGGSWLMSGIGGLTEPSDCMEAAWKYPIFPEAP